MFQAFERPELLARWWGPAGFSNTFERFEFRPGGRWVFVMHGPDGRDYPNECEFRDLEPGAVVELAHVVAPLFTLRVVLEADGDGTRLGWTQTFAREAMSEPLRAFLETANEQNLDRLAAVLAEAAVGR